MLQFSVQKTSLKIKTRDELAALSAKLRSEGRTVGFTSGTFDLLHGGHVSYLEEAKALCDVLIVGVNNDDSVKSYKGDQRPIVPEAYRLQVVAALACVDYAFLFPEKKNRANIEALRPHFYIKAGDYSPESLSSAKYLEPWAGEVKIIPFVPGLSTTGIIEKIKEVYGEPSAVELPLALSQEKKPVAFLDRDGTINREVEYLHTAEEFELLPGVLEGLKTLQEAGYRLAIVTTQAGIGLGYFTKEDFYKVNKKMLGLFHKNGIAVDKIYYCPHSKTDRCECRKPEIGLLKRGEKDLNADMGRSVMVGDKTSDILAAKNAGVLSILVETGHGGKDKEYEVSPDFKAKDLAEAAKWILQNAK